MFPWELFLVSLSFKAFELFRNFNLLFVIFSGKRYSREHRVTTHDSERKLRASNRQVMTNLSSKTTFNIM